MHISVDKIRGKYSLRGGGSVKIHDTEAEVIFREKKGQLPDLSVEIKVLPFNNPIRLQVSVQGTWGGEDPTEKKPPLSLTQELQRYVAENRLHISLPCVETRFKACISHGELRIMSGVMTLVECYVFVYRMLSLHEHGE
jgi:hypothetical protein